MFILFFVGILVAFCKAGWVPEMENPGFYQGDMILDPVQMAQVSNGTFTFGSIKNGMWPNAEVPYAIDYSLQSSSLFKSELQASIDEYHKYTCIRFVPKQAHHRAYVTFYKGGGCSSFVGYRGTENRISLAEGCWWRSTIMHEIGHSLGLHHEQSRPDRDNHVRILFNNIVGGTSHNFDKEKQSDIDSRNTPYDYWSMMHYTWDAFGQNQQMTIQTLDSKYQYEIGQDVGFSPIDVVQLQRMYNCKGTYPTPPSFNLTPGCYNLGGSCARGAYQGQCTKQEWKTYMHSKCKKACGVCGGGPVPSGNPQTLPPYTQGPPTQRPQGCSDKHTNCRDFISFCNVQNWLTHMKTNCKATCNFC